MSDISEIGTRIKALREEKGLSQKELGKLIGCPQTTVAGWESRLKRIPRKELLLPIANALNVSESYLLGIERDNIHKIKILGGLKNDAILDEKQKFLEVSESEYNKNRFSIVIKENKYQPFFWEKDYCIFEKSKAKDEDIVLIKQNEKYLLKKWKEINNLIILIDIILTKKDSFLFSKEEINSCYKGKLVVLRRYLE